MQNRSRVTAACMALMLGGALNVFAQPALKIDFADSGQGIRGSIRSENASLEFTSRVVDGVLRSGIRNPAGVQVVAYDEARVVARFAKKGARPVFEVVPALVFEGAPYRVNDEFLNIVMTRIARSPEGALIRHLALNIGSVAAAPELSSERRGLQVAFQALQNLYDQAEDSFKDALKSPPAGASQLPEGCTDKCVLLASSDFEYSANGGFVLKSLSDRLVLAHNYTRQDANAPPTQRQADAADWTPGKAGPAAIMLGDPDPNMVDNCFGRCGAGCGGWSSSWISPPTNTMVQEGCELPRPNQPPMPQPWCYPRFQVWVEEGPVLWSTSGNVTGACEAHDACVRESPFGIWDPICEIVFGPPALADYLSGAGTFTTWSYQGWSRQGSRFYVDDPDGMCCSAPQNGTAPVHP